MPGEGYDFRHKQHDLPKWQDRARELHAEWRAKAYDKKIPWYVRHSKKVALSNASQTAPSCVNRRFELIIPSAQRCSSLHFKYLMCGFKRRVKILRMKNVKLKVSISVTYNEETFLI